MKAFLMYRDRDAGPADAVPSNEHDLTQDLELTTLLQAMAREDKFVFDVARRALLAAAHNTDRDVIRYRQDIVKDCLDNPSIVRRVYAIALEAIAGERKAYWGIFSKYPGAILGLADALEGAHRRRLRDGRAASAAAEVRPGGLDLR